jgi:hypothetical protein
MTGELLINRKTKRAVDTSFGDRDCILFTFNRPSDELYTRVCGGISRKNAEAWLNGEVEHPVFGSPSNLRRYAVGELTLDVRSGGPKDDLVSVEVNGVKLGVDETGRLRDILNEILD